MLTEEGIVIESYTDSIPKVLVRTSRSTACKSCSSKGSCGTKNEKNKDIDIELFNKIGASVNDTVLLGIGSVPILRVTFLIYILPILSMVLGACLGHGFVILFAPRINLNFPMLISFLALFIALGIIRIVGTRISNSPNYKPKIIKIVKRKN